MWSFKMAIIDKKNSANYKTCGIIETKKYN